jgi:NAD(P)-dependent dehydrogenase (short-subunit alcohol dehydrogenase family)
MKRTVLITGAGSGFGKGAAIELAARGHTVIATTETQAQADALKGEHPELTVMKLDVTNAADIVGVPALKVDVLINNAGLGVLGPMASVPMDRIRASFEVNVFGMVAMSQAVIPGMKERGWGRIINVSSIAGVFASAQGSPYCMTKHAVEAFTKSLRAELAPLGIDVTKVNPGPYNTGFNDRMVNNIPSYIDPEDQAAKDMHAFVSAAILTGQLDPSAVSTALADLTEADTTPEELFLPEGIMEQINTMLGR